MQPKRQRLAERPEIILDAADTVLLRNGARGLTIDAVAPEAGRSKGGVLHHYNSKDALVAALVARKLAKLRTGIAECEVSETGERRSLAQAMVVHFRQNLCADDEISRALLVASIENPAALADYNGFVAERLDRLGAAEGGFGAGSVTVFAILGIAMGRALGLHDIPPEQFDAVFAPLDRIAALDDPAAKA